jgi:hypothetical protein
MQNFLWGCIVSVTSHSIKDLLVHLNSCNQFNTLNQKIFGQEKVHEIVKTKVAMLNILWPRVSLRIFMSQVKHI